MALSLVPILAQVLSASVGDGIEARYVDESNERYLEAENRAYATVGVNYPWLDLALTYSPSVLLSPLERSERELSITHTILGTARTAATFYETRRTSAAFNLSGSLIQENSQRELFGTQLPTTAPPPTEPGAPETEAEAAARAEDLTTRRAESRGDVTMIERLARTSTLSESAGYRVDSGLDDVSRVLYPLVHGPTANVQFLHGLSRRDVLTTKVEGELAFVPSTKGRAWFLEGEQALNHAFSRQVRGDASIGAIYTRSETPGQEPSGGFGPTGLLGLAYLTRARGGELLARFEIRYEPALDRSRLTFDSRASASATVDWNKDGLHLFALTSSTFSVTPEEAGALSGTSGSAGADYELGAGFKTHTGVRAAWQVFERDEIVPPTWVYYIGLSWSADLLSARR